MAPVVVSMVTPKLMRPIIMSSAASKGHIQQMLRVSFSRARTGTFGNAKVPLTLVDFVKHAKKRCACKSMLQAVGCELQRHCECHNPDQSQGAHLHA
eukprot:8773-Heterococcus_DN1.PRE.3